MKAQPLRQNDKGYENCNTDEATHIQLHLPGPFPNRILPIQTSGARKGTGNWSWNGSTDKPTVRPSVLTRGGYFDKEDDGKPKEVVCHCWINDGKVQFLGDCTHEFAGQTLCLLEVEP